MKIEMNVKSIGYETYNLNQHPVPELELEILIKLNGQYWYQTYERSGEPILISLTSCETYDQYDLKELADENGYLEAETFMLIG